MAIGKGTIRDSAPPTPQEMELTDLDDYQDVGKNPAWLQNVDADGVTCWNRECKRGEVYVQF